MWTCEGICQKSWKCGQKIYYEHPLNAVWSGNYLHIKTWSPSWKGCKSENVDQENRDNGWFWKTWRPIFLKSSLSEWQCYWGRSWKWQKLHFFSLALALAGPLQVNHSPSLQKLLMLVAHIWWSVVGAVFTFKSLKLYMELVWAPVWTLHNIYKSLPPP